MIKSLNKRTKKIILIIAIPVIFIVQYLLFSYGIISPLVKGVEVQIIGGNYIKEMDKYVIKLHDTVEISAGNYIKFPGYAKEPELWFNVLDDSGVVKIEDDNITAMKEGYTSVAVMKKNRVLKKAAIKVVNPEIESLDIDFSNDIKYVGDSAEIIGSVNVSDYKKFEKSYTPEYTSSNEKVIKVNGKKVNAVGVGEATISAICGDKTVETTFKIEAKVSKIDVKSALEVEEGQSVYIKPEITTDPKGLEHPTIYYEYSQSKSYRNARVSSSGKVTGVKEGTEKITVKCGEKEKTVVITVKPKSIKNTYIENISYTCTRNGNMLIINISWDSVNGVDSYDVYLKNSEKDESYRLIKSVEAGSSSKMSTEINEEITGAEGENIQIYIKGKGDGQETKVNDSIYIKTSEYPLEDNTDESEDNEQ